MHLIEYRITISLSLTLIDIKPYSEHDVDLVNQTIDQSLIVNTHETYWVAEFQTIEVIYDTSID